MNNSWEADSTNETEVEEFLHPSQASYHYCIGGFLCLRLFWGVVIGEKLVVASRYYYRRLVQMRDQLNEDEKKQFDEFFFSKRKNQTHLFVTSQFVGEFGIDRMALGQVLLGILKLITLGGFGIWTIVDYFLIGGSARQKNLNMAESFISGLRGGE